MAGRSGNCLPPTRSSQHRTVSGRRRCVGPAQRLRSDTRPQRGRPARRSPRDATQSSCSRSRAAALRAGSNKPRHNALSRSPDPPRRQTLAKPGQQPRDANGSRERAASSAEASISGSVAAPSEANKAKAFPFVSRQLLAQYDGLHKPIGLILGSAYILDTAVSLTGVPPGVSTLAALVGGSVGAFYAALNRWGIVHLWRAPSQPLNVVVTGSSKGIGKALAREFLLAGDHVVITSRSSQSVREAVAALRQEVGPEAEVYGIDTDVSSEASVARLADFAAGRLGRVDVWINNAGYSGSFKALMDLTPLQLSQVVSTNMVGTLMCTQAAMRLMAAQPGGGGHVFCMDGAGADGTATPMYSAYGATKAGIAQLVRSLQSEAAGLAQPVGVHTLSPGMVLTALLLEGATLRNKQVFNILCEQPETVAAYLVPRVRTVAARGGRASYIRFLTAARALACFLTAPMRSGRFFDEQGAAVYPPEKQRLFGDAAKMTERRAAAVARRSRTLAMAYSLSLAASYLLVAVNAPHLSS